MNTTLSIRRSQGFTLLEALVVVVFTVVFAALLLSALARPRQFNSRMACANNLKQIGTAFRIWQNDNSNAYPMEISTSAGGTMEYAYGPEVFRHFQIMQNEFGQSPRILVCPSDQERSVATNFDTFNNSNLSYFVGLNVSGTNTNPNLFLSGDRNITDGTGSRSGVKKLTATDMAGWSVGIHGNAQNPAGNILFSDGSVQTMGTPGLRQALKAPSVAPAILAVP